MWHCISENPAGSSFPAEVVCTLAKDGMSCGLMSHLPGNQAVIMHYSVKYIHIIHYIMDYLSPTSTLYWRQLIDSS
jgi:hypothetical protein